MQRPSGLSRASRTIRSPCCHCSSCRGTRSSPSEALDWDLGRCDRQRTIRPTAFERGPSPTSGLSKSNQKVFPADLIAVHFDLRLRRRPAGVRRDRRSGLQPSFSVAAHPVIGNSFLRRRDSRQRMARFSFASALEHERSRSVPGQLAISTRSRQKYVIVRTVIGIEIDAPTGPRIGFEPLRRRILVDFGGSRLQTRSTNFIRLGPAHCRRGLCSA